MSDVDILSSYSTLIVVDKEKSEELTCGICLELINDPVQCPTGHIFCRECLTLALLRKKCCPTCSCELVDTNLIGSLFIKNTVDQLIVCCSLQPKNSSLEYCHWTGARYLRDSHLANECQHNLLTCKNDKCGFKCLRSNFNSHHEECSKRPIECITCHTNIPFDSLETHKPICPSRSVSCICGEFMPLSDLEKHKQKICVEAQIECPFYYQQCCNVTNCRGLVKRFNYNNHLCQDNQDMDLINSRLATITATDEQNKLPLLKQSHHLTILKAFSYTSYTLRLLHHHHHSNFKGSYTGEIAKGKHLYGQGKLTLDDNTIIEGLWLKNQLKYGKKSFLNGNIYEGEFKNNVYHGYGVLHTKPGGDGSKERVYKGNWKEGKESGYGIETFNSIIYSGQWLDGEVNGIGLLVWSDSKHYEGSWKNNQRTGIGKGIQNNHSYNVEYMEDGSIKGTIQYNNGDIYEGSLIWKDVEYKRHGIGKFTTSSTQQVTVVFGNIKMEKKHFKVKRKK